MKFRRRRTTRRRRKADMQHFSLCQIPELLIGPKTCAEADLQMFMYPLVVGASAPAEVVDYNSAATGIRGVSVGGFQFQYSVISGCHNGNPLLTFREMYLAGICKMNFDLENYYATGGVVPAYVPPLSRGISSGGVIIPITDPTTDWLWRSQTDYAEVFPCCSGLATAADCHVNETDYSGQNNTQVGNFYDQQSKSAQAVSLPRERIKVRRFLKENEGLFWVWQPLNGQPVGVQHSVLLHVMGSVAVRVAR